MDTPSQPLTRVARAAAVGLAGLSGGCYGYGECYFRESWSQVGDFYASGQRVREIPIDAAPWLLRPCEYTTPDDCALIVNGARIPVEFTEVGARSCELDDYHAAPNSTPHVIQTLHPSQPLPPGATVTLDCGYYGSSYDADYYGSNGYSFYSQPDIPLTMLIRDGTNPAAPPVPLENLSIHYTRADPEMCLPEGDYLAIRFDFDVAFLRQGGYVEVAYANGQVFAIHSRHDWDDAAWLPAWRGPLTLTPVAIDGERGEPIEVDPDDVTEDLVYVPTCAVDPDAQAPTLLVLAGLLVVRRRRSP